MYLIKFNWRSTHYVLIKRCQSKNFRALLITLKVSLKRCFSHIYQWLNFYYTNSYRSHKQTNYFRVLADGQSAAFIINALNRKDQTSFFKYESSWKFWKQKSNVGNQFPNRLTFREERKLKEEEKRKREEKTDEAVPTVLGQVGHSCCEKCGLCQNQF